MSRSICRILLLAVGCLVARVGLAGERPNVLFIAVDDLRPELGAYGSQLVQTPHMDRLAKRSTVFTDAYCNVPICGASRASLLTGLRPLRDRFVNYDAYIRQDAPDAITLPQHFKAQGYRTVALGKISHYRDDIKADWSEPPWRPDYPLAEEIQVTWRDYQLPENQAAAAAHPDEAGPPYERADVPDNAYRDGQIAQRAVATIERMAAGDEPFFLGVGFIKPHLPFNAPSKYWDLYDADDFELPDNYFPPEGAPKAAMHNFGELRNGYTGVPAEGPLSRELALQLIHGYHACVSYVDTLVGRVLAALEASGEADNTIIVLWGDHGWSLGEHMLWCKHANFKTALQVPLMIHAPGYPEGQHTAALTELIDLFPTLCELAGLPPPPGLEGASLTRYLRDPDQPGKSAVYSRWINGFTVTTPTHAYTEWHNPEGRLYDRMLYDRATDPAENRNVAEDPRYAETVKMLSAMLSRMSP